MTLKRLQTVKSLTAIPTDLDWTVYFAVSAVRHLLTGFLDKNREMAPMICRYEPPREEMYLLTCALNERLKSAYSSTQSDHSLHYSHEETLHPWLSKNAPNEDSIRKTEVYTGIHYFFLFLFKNIDCGYSLAPPRRGGFIEYPRSLVLSRNKRNNAYPCKPKFYYIKVGFKGVNIIYACFRNVNLCWTHMFEGTFSDVASRLIPLTYEPGRRISILGNFL